MNARTGLRIMVWASTAVIAIDSVLAGFPASQAARIAVPIITAAGLALWLAGTASKITDIRIVTLCFTAAGLCGAVLDRIQIAGPGYILGFMALAGMGLRLPRRIALISGGIVVVSLAVAEAYTSQQGLQAFLNLGIGGCFLFLSSAFAGANRLAREAAEAQLAEEAAAREAREEAARLAERGRMARELHDVLAHTLSGLAVHLEGARLLAEKTSADPRLVAQLTDAHGLARDGLAGARRVVETLRGDPLPGPAHIPELAGKAGATFAVTGVPQPLPGEAGLALYRTVQEALTNTAKHAGPLARADVVLAWTPTEVAVTVTDSGGVPDPDSVLPSGGFGLTGLAERAALAGGHLEAGPSGAGWRVNLTLPLGSR
ncbi:sensor histidine kinase [Winogradskya consettensis]|nr:histidine kinase [Actinoplanes consettensis]